MNFLTKAYVRMTERRGQSMTEYALIVAAVAVAGFAAYNALGNQIKSLLSGIVVDLTPPT